MKPPPSVASRISEDCLLLVLDYLWDDKAIAQFIERRSEYSQDYDQIRIHHTLRSRTIAPVHVCQAWRHHSIRRYFRYISIGMVVHRQPREAKSIWAFEQLPAVAGMLVETLLLQVDTAKDNCQLAGAAARLARVLPHELPRARRIGICVGNSTTRRRPLSFHTADLMHRYAADNCLALEILCKMPVLECIWFQSTTVACLAAHNLVHTLANYGAQNNRESGKHLSVRVSSIHLESTTTDDDDFAIDIIRECAHDIQNLCLGAVSGGVLSTLIKWRPSKQWWPQGGRASADTALNSASNSPTTTRIDSQDTSSSSATPADLIPATYPRLRRLIFGVDTHVHVEPGATGPMQGTTDVQQGGLLRSHPFPVLEELYFDHTLSNGLPMEEWYAPLYDVFLGQPNKELRHLAFPIIYNTQRTVSRINCPKLESLRHIKCCWSTGMWSAAQAESDSTRVLKAVATIPTLTCYIHPSYIEGLSALPTEINCTALGYLDLYGWPLSLDHVQWLLATFTCMRSLSVTVVPAAGAPPLSDRGDLTATDGHSSSIGVAVGPLLRNLVVGAGSGDLDAQELSLLFVLLNRLSSISTIALYSGAYSFVKTHLEECCGLCFPDTTEHLQKVRISNLGSVGLTSTVSGDRQTYYARRRESTIRMLGTIPSMESLVVPWRGRRLGPTTRTHAVSRVSSDNGNTSGWQMIHRLLLGE
ncbi:hypothetical protein EV175_001539 [Coemansia sp. RSA 1933]|nr:hypothetical protein EV175_001539 [Coemansia sp. RSA 1933]